MKVVTRIERFDDSLYYAPSDPAMRVFGTVGSLSIQRHRGIGPPFVRVGRRILYRGSDLNRILDAGRVETAA